MQWFAQAPCNIALIKYMGKKNSEKNIPINPSLSYTLNHLVSSVSLEQYPGHHDYWEPLEIPGAIPDFNMSQKSRDRFLKHLEKIKKLYDYDGSFIVRSNNNFPMGSGLASSASSFAALTKCAFLALTELCKKEVPSTEYQASISRLGSGSSCRSFYSPWALWRDEEVTAPNLPWKDLKHQVVITSHEEKAVSSSSAHERIKTSKLYPMRASQAENNLKSLLAAINSNNWRYAFEVCWREFHEMHQLFATSNPPFSYMIPETREVLKLVEQFWDKENDGPIVTMDAGPNVHLFYRPNQEELAHKFKLTRLVGNYDVL